MNKKTQKITTIHSFDVDECIAEEIEQLNNIHKVFTLTSCCGHGDEGYILVGGSDIEKMVDLGYKGIKMEYKLIRMGWTDKNSIETNSKDDSWNICLFEPKSKCFCKFNGNKEKF